MTRDDARAWAAPHALTLVQAGSLPFTLWDGRAFLWRRPDPAMEDDAEARWIAAMRRGDFAHGPRRQRRSIATRDPRTRDDPSLPYHCRWVWDGRSVRGRGVLIRCYHGLGDTLQFARFIPEIVERAASVAVEVPPPLLPLLLAGLGGVRLIPFDPAHPAPPAGCDIEIMELFQICRPEADSLPPPVPLPPRAPLRRGGRDRPVLGGGRLGPCPVVPVAAIARGGRTRPALVSLQRGPAASEARPRASSTRRTTAPTLRTAALIAGVSEVVTVDTMVAHLAGTLGGTVRLLLRREADWRWMTGRDDTPWYPGMRLYRQERRGTGRRRLPGWPANSGAGRQVDAAHPYVGLVDGQLAARSGVDLDPREADRAASPENARAPP